MSEPLEPAYLTLLVQVAGVVAGALLLAAILGAGRRALQPVMAGGVAVLLLITLMGRTPDAGKAFTSVRETMRVPPGYAPFEKCFLDSGNTKGPQLARWMRARIPAGERFAIRPVAGVDRPCYQLNLAPRRLVDASERPPWILFQGPRARRLASAALGAPATDAHPAVDVFDRKAILVRQD